MAPKTNSKVKLIETAIDLVRMSSYTDVGVNEICEKAGVTKGAFYHHFKSNCLFSYSFSIIRNRSFTFK